MYKRIPAANLRPGDVLISVGKTEINGRVTKIVPAVSGDALRGPRGGRYVVTVPGSSLIVHTTKSNPVVRPETAVTVYEQPEW